MGKKPTHLARAFTLFGGSGVRRESLRGGAPPTRAQKARVARTLPESPELDAITIYDDERSACALCVHQRVACDVLQLARMAVSTLPFDPDKCPRARDLPLSRPSRGRRCCVYWCVQGSVCVLNVAGPSSLRCRPGVVNRAPAAAERKSAQRKHQRLNWGVAHGILCRCVDTAPGTHFLLIF